MKKWLASSSLSSWMMLLIMGILLPSATTTSTVSHDDTDDSTSTLNNNNNNKYTLAMVTKSLDNPFFNMAHQACFDHAAALGCRCLLLGPQQEQGDLEGQAQARLIDEIVANQTAQGIAVAVQAIDTVGPAIDRAVAAGIPVVTFDSDAPDSRRLAYIGTDNYFLGQTIAKVLKQLRPQGGTYAVITHSAPNLQLRAQGFQDELESTVNDKNEAGHSIWRQAKNSPADWASNLTLIVEQLHMFANYQGEDKVDAIVPVMGAAMRSGGWVDFVQTHRHRNFSLVSGDAMANQLEFLDSGYAHGLVGQLPFEMGKGAIQTLYDVLEEGRPPAQAFIGTNVVSHIFIPLVLPELVVDHNLIGNLHVVGYILFGIIALMALAFGAWTVKSRNLVVVKAAQPTFLLMILVGVLCMAASMIPLSFDDNGNPSSQNERKGVVQCMSVPWRFCGFTISFSALFAKTMRVNKIFHGGDAIRRIQVSEAHVMRPFFFLFGSNVVVLTLWTILDPLVYQRQNLPGTDGWNRVLSTYGSCQSENVTYYLVPMAVLNLGVLVLANWQAYGARNIVSEFSECKYIGLTNMSLLQSIGMGIPLLFVVRESPQAFYLILEFMIFITCAAILLLIFVPKMVLADTFQQHSPQQQSIMIKNSIRESQNNIKSSRGARSQQMSCDFASTSSFKASDPQSLELQPETALPRREESEKDPESPRNRFYSRIAAVTSSSNHRNTGDETLRSHRIAESIHEEAEED